MQEIQINTSAGVYAVRVGSSNSIALAQAADAVIVDRVVADRNPGLDNGRLIPVDAGEEAKTLAGCETVLSQMHRLGLRRGDRIAAIGGGSVQDIATFAASVYMRGVSWGYAPSTTMAMMDSCVGGKSSINVGGIKNLVGNIYPPSEVAVDTALIAGLSVGARISGLAEAVKICFCRGRVDFDSFLELSVSPQELGDDTQTRSLIIHALSSKKWFIEIDEHDRRERQLLNFGHTYAHAFESATQFAVPHGVAVAVGMLAATLHPVAMRDTSTESLQDYCRNLLKPIYSDLAIAAGLLDWDRFARAVASDKKGTRDHLRLVVPSTGGGVSVVEVPRRASSIESIRTSMENALAEVVP